MFLTCQYLYDRLFWLVLSKTLKTIIKRYIILTIIIISFIKCFIYRNTSRSNDAPANMPTLKETAQIIIEIVVGSILNIGTKKRGSSIVIISNSVKHNNTYKSVKGNVIMLKSINIKESNMSSKDLDWNNVANPNAFILTVSFICQDSISWVLVL